MSEQGPEFGISFEKKDGSKRFVPYSLLSAVDFDGSDRSEKLVFRYTSGTVTIEGHALQVLWKALCQCLLSRVCESGTASSGETSIDTITVVDFTDPSLFEPKFPGKEN